MRSARSFSSASLSSILTMAKSVPAKECLRAFWEARALPAGVRGPVECWALARLAAVCLSDGMEEVPLGEGVARAVRARRWLQW